MYESPYTAINKVLTEPTNGYDDLRIIAKDRGGMDRALIEDAADEFETTQRNLVQVYAQLIEAQQKLIAANDVILALRCRVYQGLPMQLDGVIK
jgi:uncharacterized protein (UPF0248 family)